MLVELGPYQVFFSPAKIEAAVVNVCARVIENHITRQLDLDHNLAKQRWVSTAAKTGAAPPEWPATAVFLPLNVRLFDEARTPYELDQFQVGGTGTEWRACWRFRPTPPEGVTDLTVHVTVGGKRFRSRAN
jgi:hypothetical protein